MSQPKSDFIESNFWVWAVAALVCAGAAAYFWYPYLNSECTLVRWLLVITSFAPAALILLGRPNPPLEVSPLSKTLAANYKLAMDHKARGNLTADALRALVITLSTAMIYYIVNHPNGAFKDRVNYTDDVIQALVLAALAVALSIISSLHQKAKSAIRYDSTISGGLKGLTNANNVCWPETGWISRRRIQMAVRNETIDQLSLVALLASGLIYIDHLSTLALR